MWTARSGPSLFDHLKSIFLQIQQQMLIQQIMLDGATWRRLIQIASCLVSFEVWRFQFLFMWSLQKNDLILSSPRFEPTTFLIQVNTQVFTPKTTVPWLVFRFSYFSFSLPFVFPFSIFLYFTLFCISYLILLFLSPLLNISLFHSL